MIGTASSLGLLLFLTPCSLEEAAANKDRHDVQRFLQLVDCWLGADERKRLLDVLPAPGAASPSALRFALGTRLAKHGMYGEAILQLQAIPEEESDAAVTFNLGLCHSLSGKYEVARKYYFSTIDHDADHTEAYFRVGLDFAAAGERGKAIAWLLRARRLAPNRPEIVYALVEELLSAHYFQSAEAILASAVARLPGNALLRTALGDLALAQGNISVAVEEYRRAMQLDPGLSAGAVGLARALAQEQRPSEAVRILNDVVARGPLNGAAHALLGQLSLESQAWDIAMLHLEKAAKADPLNMKITVGLARCHRAKGMPHKAVAILAETRRQGSGDKSYHLELAQNLKALGRAAEAQRELKTVQQIEQSAREVLAFVPPGVYIH